MTGNSWIIIGVVATAIAAFSLPYGFYNKSKERNSSPIQITGDYVAGSKVTGGGDYVAGDKIVSMGPSTPELEKIVKRMAKEFDKSLSQKYSDKTVFGITPQGFVVPKGHVASGITVSWETGSVLQFTDRIVKVALPNLVANTKHIKNFKMLNTTVTLQAKVGTHIGLMKTPDFSINVEVLGIDRNLVVVGLGLAGPD